MKPETPHPIDLIDQKIVNGDLLGALAHFGEDTFLRSDAVALKGQLTELKNRDDKGLLHTGEYTVERNRIREQVITLREKLLEGPSPQKDTRSAEEVLQDLKRSVPNQPAKSTQPDFPVRMVLAIGILPSIYALGYLIWALNSLNFHLGPMPAFHSQYMVAGLIPFGILVGGWYGGRGLKHLLEKKWPIWINGDHSLAIILKLLFRLVFWGGMVIFILDYFFPISETLKQTVIYVLVGLVTFGDEKLGMGLGKYFRWFWVRYGIFAAIALGLVFYFDKLYPWLPQEFGGVNPRCARLEVARQELSQETLYQFIPGPAISMDDPVVATHPLDIYFSNSELVVVKPLNSERKTPAIHLDANLVKSTTPCSKE